MEPLHVELVAQEALRQVIQQGLVAGRIGHVHIIRRVDNPLAEIIGPDPVDEGPGEIRVVLAPHPLHQRFTWVVNLGERDLVTAQQFGCGDSTTALRAILRCATACGSVYRWSRTLPAKGSDCPSSSPFRGCAGARPVGRLRKAKLIGKLLDDFTRLLLRPTA